MHLVLFLELTLSNFITFSGINIWVLLNAIRTLPTGLRTLEYIDIRIRYLAELSVQFRLPYLKKLLYLSRVREESLFSSIKNRCRPKYEWTQSSLSLPRGINRRMKKLSGSPVHQQNCPNFDWEFRGASSSTWNVARQSWSENRARMCQACSIQRGSCEKREQNKD